MLYLFCDNKARKQKQENGYITVAKEKETKPRNPLGSSLNYIEIIELGASYLLNLSVVARCFDLCKVMKTELSAYFLIKL